MTDSKEELNMLVRRYLSKTPKALLGMALGAAIGVGAFTAGTASADEQVIPSLVYRTGPYAPGGISLADGFADYFNLINERDGGINGVKLKVVECETGYNTDRGVECYDRTKNEGSGATFYSPWSTGITYALIEKATQDKIPILSMGYGRTSAADGRYFPYVFNFPSTYWNQATAIVQYIADQEGGVDKLKGKNFAYIYLDHPYGKEPLPTLDILAQKFGFSFDRYPVPPASMTEQKSIWLKIRRQRPDYAIMWGWGAMNGTAVNEAASIKFPMDHFIGNWWAAGEDAVEAAGDGAVGYKAANFHGAGADYPLYQDLKKYIYDTGKFAGKGDQWGRVLYNRGISNAIVAVEAIRAAQAKYGNRVITGEEMQWALENLNMTDDDIAKLGATGLTPAVQVTCQNHEGQNPAVLIQQWNGSEYEIISDWVPAMSDLTRPLIEKDAEAYAAEQGLQPRSCS